MTLAEFKAWFAGYTEDMDGPPSAKQWKRVKKRVSEIDGTITTERIFVDRWVNQYWPAPIRPYYATCANDVKSTSIYVDSMAAAGVVHPEPFDGEKAMLTLGKAEYAAEQG